MKLHRVLLSLLFLMPLALLGSDTEESGEEEINPDLFFSAVEEDGEGEDVIIVTEDVDPANVGHDLLEDIRPSVLQVFREFFEMVHGNGSV